MSKHGYYYDTFDDVLNDPFIRAGLVVTTLGKDIVNDTGGCMYRIKKYSNAVVINEEEGVEFRNIKTGEHLFAEKLMLSFAPKSDDMTNDELTQAFKSLKSDVDTQFENFNKNYGDTIKTLTLNVNSTLSDIKQISSEVNRVIGGINESINNVAVNLDEQIDAVNGTIDIKIGQVNDSINTVNETLTNRINNTNDMISSTESRLSAEISSAREEASTRDKLISDSIEVIRDYMDNDEVISVKYITESGSVKFIRTINGKKFVLFNTLEDGETLSNTIAYSESSKWIIPANIVLTNKAIKVYENDEFKFTLNDDDSITIDIYEAAFTKKISEFS